MTAVWQRQFAGKIHFVLNWGTIPFAVFTTKIELNQINV